MLKNIVLAIAILYSVALLTVSLVSLEDVPDLGLSFSDKIFHFIAYALMTFLWFLAIKINTTYTVKKSIVISAILSIAFGFLIEVLQDKLTTYRTLDLYDVAANTIGVLLAVIVLLNNKPVKKI